MQQQQMEECEMFVFCLLTLTLRGNLEWLLKKKLHRGKVGFMCDGKDRCGQISCIKVTSALCLFSTR